MSESKKIEFIDREAEELAEYSNLGPAIQLEYIIDRYFRGPHGQDKLIKILEKKIPKQEDREDILDFISDLMMEKDDDKFEEKVKNLDKKFDLVNILSEAVGKTREELEKELALSLVEKAESLKAALTRKTLN